MRKIILLAHISLDGFVAGPKGELDGFPVGDENLGFVCDLTKSADAAMFGRVSYHLLDDFWPNAKERPSATENEIRYSNWYNKAEKIVFSKTISKPKTGNARIIEKIDAEEINTFRNQQGKDILIFGSPSISQQLMQLGLIDEFWIFINPVLFAKGIPLFLENDNRTRLKLLSATPLSNGEIATHYEFAK